MEDGTWPTNGRGLTSLNARRPAWAQSPRVDARASWELSVKRLAFAVVLFALCGSALAEWTRFASNPSQKMTAYIDPATIERAGNIVRIWVLLDFEQVQMPRDHPAFSSFRSQKEFNCGKEQLRLRAVVAYSGNMGSGDVVEDIAGSTEEWSAIPSNSLDAGFYRAACEK
jgi:hypothetical protein